MGSWAEDHGKILTPAQPAAASASKVKADPQAAAVKAASHAKDELAVAAGLKAHGDKL